MIRHTMPAFHFGYGRGCVPPWLMLLCLAPTLSRCCYFCFTAAEEQVRLCKFISERTSWTVTQCLDNVKRYFAAATDMLIPNSQKDKVKQLIQGYYKSIQKEEPTTDNWFISLERLASKYTEQMKDMVARNKPAVCKPPCGFQKAAHVFSCSECLDIECDYPVDCPIEDVNVREPERTFVDCNMSFPLPEDVSVTWKFAERVRTKDLSFFKNIHTGEDTTLLIQPTRPFHHGTYSCVITDEDDDIIAEKFFFVNVSRVEYTADSQLGAIFQAVVHSNMMPEEQIAAPSSRFIDSFMGTLLDSGQTMSLKAAIYIAVAFGLIVLLIIMACGAACFYANDVDPLPPEERMLMEIP